MILDTLFETIENRKGADPKSSYTAKLLSKGRPTIAKKLGEEATETVIAALAETDEKLVSESADLLYHLLVLWAEAGLKPDQIWQELEGRFGISGIDEKNSRPKD